MLDDVYNLPTINKPKLFMKVIAETAEMLPGNYILKKFKATNIKGEEKPFSTIWIISKKNALNEFDDKKVYFRNEFTEVVKKLLEEKCSLICMTENGEGSIIDPKIYNYDGSRVEKYESLLAFDIMTCDKFSNISFYLYNDGLLDIVKLIISIAKNNKEILSSASLKPKK